ncbi:MAG: NPCBM/NEW2 domain-containing protein [Planctomycetota bacterium]
MRSVRVFILAFFCAAVICLLQGGEALWAKVEVNAVSGEKEFVALSKIDVQGQSFVFDETNPIKWTDMLEVKLAESIAPPETGYKIYFRNQSAICGEVIGGRILGALLYVKVKSAFTNNKEVEFNAGALAAIQNRDLSVYRLCVLNLMKTQAETAPFGRILLGGVKMTAKDLQALFDKNPAKFDAEARSLLEETTGDFEVRIDDKERQKYDFYHGVKEDESEFYGVINKLAENLDIEFAYKSEDETRKVEGNLAKIVGLSFEIGAQPAGYDTRPYVRIRGVSGEVVTGEIIAAGEGVVTLKTDLTTRSREGNLEPVKFEIPVARIAHVEFYNGSFEFLSDFPAGQIASLERGILVKVGTTVSPMFHWERDRSVLALKPPLTLGGKVYRKGIGCHSYSKLTFSIGGNYSRFKSLVGIDDKALSGADVDIEIQCDGVTRYTKKGLKNRDVEKIDIDVKGVKQLTLIVDFGKNGEHHDSVDWANAILVK